MCGLFGFIDNFTWFVCFNYVPFNFISEDWGVERPLLSMRPPKWKIWTILPLFQRTLSNLNIKNSTIHSRLERGE